MEKNKYRFSGHESFSCRYAWLPKAAQAIDYDNTILTPAREDDAMVALGVGKNMVRSIRFWATAADIISATEIGHNLTQFGKEIFLGCEPRDPYLEDIQTLWLLHWKISTNQRSLIFAWDYLMNEYHEPELYASAVVKAFEKYLPRITDKKMSLGSLEQLYNVFLHTYFPARGRKGEISEDNLDCPLVELELLRMAGSAQSIIHPGHWEAKYIFRWEEKPEVSSALFAYCLNDFWNNHFAFEKTGEHSLSFQSIVVGHGSPGQIFKIPEWNIRSRLLNIEKQTQGYFVFEESAAIPRVVRKTFVEPPSLKNIYCWDKANV
jgi:Protein of unknown function (DUF4007)